jgi:tripartite-type tricarboxylate transporter receptor subunit TctC
MSEQTMIIWHMSEQAHGRADAVARGLTPPRREKAMTGYCRSLCVAFALIAASGSGSAAEDLAAFYSGKTVTVTSPFDLAGGYGQIATLVANYLPKYLPGHPSAISQNMPGGGGVRQANYMYNAAPRDGTVIGIIYDSVPEMQMLDPDQVLFDAGKFNALGSVNRGDFGLVGILKTAGIASLADAQKKETFFGASGTAAAQYIVPYVMNEVLGTKFKLIPGYGGVGEQFLAMEKGELQGIFTNYTTILLERPDWVAQGRFYWLAQLSDQRNAALPDVPLIQELVSDPVDRKAFEFLALSRVIGKIFIAPPGVPAERLAALRTAFAEVLKEKELQAALAKIQVDYDPRTWEPSQQVILETVETLPDIVARVRDLIRIEK